MAVSNEHGTDEYPKFILPGEVIPVFSNLENVSDTSSPLNVKLGPGLFQDKENIIAVKAGLLHHRTEGNKWWIESNQKRYIAAAGENVIGIVTQRLSDAFKLDIGTAFSAVLPILAFEGASKRNKQNLNVGDLVYARISMATKDMDPELECVNPKTQKSDGYGVLNGGTMIRSSLGYCRSLLSPKSHVMKLLGDVCPFEVAIGMNGRIWINGGEPTKTTLLAHCLKNGEDLSEKEFKMLVTEVFEKSNHYVS